MKIKSLILTIMSIFGFTDSALSESPEWDALVKESYDFLYKQQDILEEDYLLSKHKRWDYDQDTGDLVFSNDGVPAVIAEFQFVGSISTTSETGYGLGQIQLLMKNSVKN